MVPEDCYLEIWAGKLDHWKIDSEKMVSENAHYDHRPPPLPCACIQNGDDPNFLKN